MPILYSENKFHFRNVDYIRRVIGENSVDLVTNIVVAGFLDDVGPEKLNSLLFEPFQALTKLTFQTQCDLFDEEERPSKVSELHSGAIVSTDSNWIPPNKNFVPQDSQRIGKLVHHKARPCSQIKQFYSATQLFGTSGGKFLTSILEYRHR